MPRIIELVEVVFRRRAEDPVHIEVDVVDTKSFESFAEITGDAHAIIPRRRRASRRRRPRRTG